MHAECGILGELGNQIGLKKLEDVFWTTVCKMRQKEKANSNRYYGKSRKIIEVRERERIRDQILEKNEID